MFQDWGNFFFLTGSAAAALVGLLFIVATLTVSQEQSKTYTGQQVFLTPIVFDFAIIVIISCVTMAPALLVPVIALVVGLCGVAGLAYSAFVCVAIRGRKGVEAPHWSDFWYYGVAPAVGHLGLVAAAVAVWATPTLAPYEIGAVLLFLLMVAIRNAWDLVTWLAPRQGRKIDQNSG